MKIIERYGTVLRCYDNGGKSFDRYTILPPRWAHIYRNADSVNYYCFDGIGSSEDPGDPQGVGMWIQAVPGKHLGKRIKWSDLPTAVQAFARRSFEEYAP